jgi:hypothetical protein
MVVRRGSGVPEAASFDGGQLRQRDAWWSASIFVEMSMYHSDTSNGLRPGFSALRHVSGVE